MLSWEIDHNSVARFTFFEEPLRLPDHNESGLRLSSDFGQLPLPAKLHTFQLQGILFIDPPDPCCGLDEHSTKRNVIPVTE